MNKDITAVRGLTGGSALGWKSSIITSQKEVIFEHDNVLLHVDKWPINNLIKIGHTSYRVISENIDTVNKLVTILVN